MENKYKEYSLEEMDSLLQKLQQRERVKYELQAQLYEDYLKRIENSNDPDIEYKKIIEELNQFSENSSIALQALKKAYEVINVEKFIKNKHKNNKDESKNIEIFEMYNKILDEMVLLSKQLGLTKSLEHSILFSILYSQGYLSCDKNFYYDNTENYPDDKFAFSIFSGIGVCRHISDFLTDFLNRFDTITAAACCCNLPNKVLVTDNSLSLKVVRRRKTTADFKIFKTKRTKAKKILLMIMLPLIKIISKISKNVILSLIPGLYKKELNHAVVLISDKTKSKEVFYGYDPTNLFPIEAINQDINSPKFKYSFYPANPSEFGISESLLLLKPSEKSIELLKNFYSRKESIPFLEITSKQVRTIEDIINNNTDLLNDFYERVYPYIEQIHEYNIRKTKPIGRKNK